MTDEALPPDGMMEVPVNGVPAAPSATPPGSESWAESGTTLGLPVFSGASSAPPAPAPARQRAPRSDDKPPGGPNPLAALDRAWEEAEHPDARVGLGWRLTFAVGTLAVGAGLIAEGVRRLLNH